MSPEYQRRKCARNGDKAMREYNGWRSWNAWNVALYISNEYDLYQAAVDCLRRTKTIRAAVNLFCRETGLLGTCTADGAIYNALCIKFALESLEIEQAI